MIIHNKYSRIVIYVKLICNKSGSREEIIPLDCLIVSGCFQFYSVLFSFYLPNASVCVLLLLLNIVSPVFGSTTKHEGRLFLVIDVLNRNHVTIYEGWLRKL